MKKYLFFLLLLNFCYLFVEAGNDKRTLGARAAGVANASVTFADAYAVFANQAGLANINSLTASVYAENRFLLKDLNLFGMGVAIPTQKTGTFAIGASYFGSANYNESQIALGYGRKLFEKLSIGVSLDFFNLSIAEYGSQVALTFGIGLQYHINDFIKVGGRVHNPMRIATTEFEEDNLPTLVNFGLAFSPSDKVSVFAEAEKNIHEKAIIKVGIEYHPIDILYVRVGSSSNPSNLSFGVGLDVKVAQIDFASSFHPTLGYTPQISITYSGKRK